MIDDESANPYAPPRAPLDAHRGGQCWRAGKMLVVPAGASLPHRCVKCNAAARMDKPRIYRWHSPGWYGLIILFVLVYVVVGLIVRKQAEVAFGLCETHRKRRMLVYSALASLLVVGLLCLAGAMTERRIELANVAGLSLLASLILGALAGRLAPTPTRIDAVEARFRGCGKAFLDSLPGR